MEIFFTVFLIAVAAFFIYRSRASFTDAKDPPITGPADNTAGPAIGKDKL